MKRIRAVLSDAVDEGIITEAQAHKVQALAAQRYGEEAEPANGDSAGMLRFTHLLYYVGGFMAIGAMSVFMTLGWEEFGAWGLLSIAVAYALFSAALTEALYRKTYRIPAGITATLTVVLVPLAVYGAQLAAGWWPAEVEHRPFFAGFDRRALMLQGAAMITAGAALLRYQLPFLMLSVSVLVWYFGMSAATVAFALDATTTTAHLWTSAGLGALITGAAAGLSWRGWADFSAWPYVVGGLMLWGSLTLLTLHDTLPPGAYAGLNIVGLMAGVAVQRRVFVITGALGVAGYLAYLAYDVFQGSVWFPFALTCLGLATVGCGIWWQRHEATIRRRLRTYAHRLMR